MREVVIVEAVRTAVGRGHPEKGVFRALHPDELLGAVLVEVIARAGIPPAAVQDVIGGCVQQVAEQAYNVTRNAWLAAGLPVQTPAMTVDGSSAPAAASASSRCAAAAAWARPR